MPFAAIAGEVGADAIAAGAVDAAATGVAAGAVDAGAAGVAGGLSAEGLAGGLTAADAAGGFGIGAGDLAGFGAGEASLGGALDAAGISGAGGLFGGSGSSMLPSWLTSMMNGGGALPTGATAADPLQAELDAAGINATGSNAASQSSIANALNGGGGMGGTAGTLGKGINMTQAALGVLAGLGSALGKKSSPAPPGPSSTAATQGPYFNAPLQPSGFIDRTPLNPLPAGGYQNYGSGPAQNFFANNQLKFRHGGALSYAAGGGAPFDTDGGENYVQGEGDGTADKVPANLSDGEYVLTARDVAALGNGSNKAGAERLDHMRALLHRDWGSKKPIGPSITKGPLSYAQEAA